MRQLFDWKDAESIALKNNALYNTILFQKKYTFIGEVK